MPDQLTAKVVESRKKSREHLLARKQDDLSKTREALARIERELSDMTEAQSAEVTV